MRKTRWTREAIIEEARLYKNRTDFNRKSRQAYDKAKLLGMLTEIYPDKKIKKTYVKWTEDLIVKAARQYKTRSEMARWSPNAYQAARRKELLEKLYPTTVKLAEFKSEQNI